MNTVKKLSKYTIIVSIGTLIALFVAWVQYDTKDLSASILSLTEQNFFESTQWDAGYKKENQIFEVFLSKHIKYEGPLFISIIYSPIDLHLFTGDITSKYSTAIIEQNKGKLILTIDGYKDGNYSEGIFQLPYTGNSKDITLEYIKSQSTNFAIGNLDNIKTNDQSH